MPTGLQAISTAPPLPRRVFPGPRRRLSSPSTLFTSPCLQLPLSLFLSPLYSCRLHVSDGVVQLKVPYREAFSAPPLSIVRVDGFRRSLTKGKM